MPTERLPPHIEALKSSDAYAHAPERIDLIQTHISYVFLADDEVFKVKKAMDLGFVDFTTLTKRKKACEAEVRLNRRGCSASVYLGVEPITRGADGSFQIAGEGKPVDFAVHMKRLPQNRMMDELLARKEVDFNMIGRIAARVTQMHQNAERGERITRIGGARTLAKNWRDTLDSMREFAGETLSQARLQRIEAYATGFLEREATLLKRRQQEGWVRDCHGDMRSDAVCFDASLPDGLCIYDCIEFNDALRYSDTALDVAFLAMDLDYRGHRDLSDLFIGLYTPAISDPELPLLLDFYKSYRACVRGKVESLLAQDRGVDAKKRAAARRRARDYFRLADSYARKQPRRGVIMVSGPSGSGKSVLAGALASRTGSVLLSTDMLRAQSTVESGRGSAIDAGKYSEVAREKVYADMLQRAGDLIQQGRPIVLDATFIEKRQRASFVELAHETKQRLLIVECSAPDEVIRRRQQQREHESWTTSEGRYEVYVAQQQRIEPADEVPASDRVAVDTTLELEKQLALVEGSITGAGRPS